MDEARDRILIVVTGDESSASVIRRGRRVADYLQAECYAVALQDRAQAGGLIEKNLTYARNLHIETRLLEGKAAAQAIVDFAHLHRITRIFVGRQTEARRFGIGRTLVQKIVHLAGDMQVTLVADRRTGR